MTLGVHWMCLFVVVGSPRQLMSRERSNIELFRRTTLSETEG